MPAVASWRKKLIDEVLDGNVAAGVELARRVGCQSITELLATVCPKGCRSVELFDTCADAWSLFNYKKEVVR